MECGVGGQRRIIAAAAAATLLLAAAACDSAVEPSASDPMNVTRVVVLGDSLALSPTAERNFTTELQARADGAGVRTRVSNPSVWGDTTADSLRRIDAALADGPHTLGKKCNSRLQVRNRGSGAEAQC